MTKTYKRYYSYFAKIFKYLYNIKVVGYENIPEKDGFLVCSNHFSATDPIKICYAFKGHQVCYMAKKELFRIPVLSYLIRVLGAFPIDRSKADVGAIKHMMKLLTDGQNGGMFPQGTRHPKKDPRETVVKSGAGMITIRTQATVVPVFIDQKNFKHRAFRRSTVYIGKPITFEEFNYDSEAPGEKARISKQIFDAVCKVGKEHGALK